MESRRRDRKSSNPYDNGSKLMKKRSGNTTSQAPVITRCQHIHNNLIARIDPQLWERLETEGVEAQIWAMYVPLASYYVVDTNE
jgi:hypothetical protein